MFREEGHRGRTLAKIVLAAERLRRGRDALPPPNDACHLAHAQRIRSQPRQLLAGIPGVVLCEVNDGEQCCGSAGIYNLVQPESARQVGERKVDNVFAAGPGDDRERQSGCTLQIEQVLRARGKSFPSAHPIEILDASIRGTKP